MINIGGVANLSFIALGKEPFACDTGPGNALLDDLMLQRLTDRGGAAAAQGKVDRKALDELLAHPFLRRRRRNHSTGMIFPVARSRTSQPKARRRH